MPAPSIVPGRYGFADRLIHRLAFAHPAFQRALGDVENDLFADALHDAHVNEPVFVTALPRAGTTLLLELLYSTGDFFTFTYRQMPFVLTPLLWDRLSRPFQKAAVAAERAHGDGMQVSVESPEAFEEVLWLNQLRSSYVGETSIRPVPPDAITPAFREMFGQVLLKLQRLDAAKRGGARPRRYLSKNNMNVARLDTLPALFPDATVLLCVRDPLTQAASLKAQHDRFSALHETDGFARRYMEWIGHYDFGANFKPIDFAGTGALADAPRTAEFWLRYWIEAYRHAQRHLNGNCRVVAFEALIEPGGRTLHNLAAALQIHDPRTLTAQAERLRRPRSAGLTEAMLPPELVAEARSIYAELRSRSL